MEYIFLTREEKKKVEGIVKRGEKLEKRIQDFTKMIRKELDESLYFMKRLRVRDYRIDKRIV